MAAVEVAEVERWCVVTGGRGFAARHLVEMLIRYEMFHVRIADLAPAIQLEPHEDSGVLGGALRSGRANYVSADLRNKAQVIRAFQGAEVVFHMAAPDSSINNYQLQYSVNVEGTKNVIGACVEVGVKRLIYTSSPSVVFDGVHGVLNADESMPYPPKHNDSYSATKAEGEALVMKANGTNGLLTCSIRPSSIFGPGDRLMVPSLVAAARAGKSKFIIGDGNNFYDFTYVENVVHAHVCAERALASGGEVSEKAAGQAYFITNMEPIKFWEFMSQILEGLGYERPRIKIPAVVMMPIAHLVEVIYKLLGPYGMKVPQLTPSRVRLLSRSRTFDCSKAKDRLGYSPVVPLQEGIRRTINSFSHLRVENKPNREGSSKASRFLGDGKVADTLLWKDKKQSLFAILILFAIYYNFVATGSSIITALAKVLLAASIFLFIHGLLPEKIFGYKIEKIHPSQFHLSEESSRQLSLSVISLWNEPVKTLKSLCQGNDWSLFLKVVLILLVLSFAGALSLRSLFVIGVPIGFTAFLVYDKKEQEVDSMVLRFKSSMRERRHGISAKLFGNKKND
ncbi:PREDICTED: 3beta-hydroxysteroid-dehydrogenase/decarboxylase [Tarenaya hassleriana]|uniref:3beta-hydroxysteroid- dehydrogenase/decarboxylase n=1 Tax=Tarenaya hassleriana TaxID=28532 RepID=UPI00053C0BD7|nr:PREDICTED: 3beta-hydroxysteroid-dehydrogenase/decarboxylase [Tarenaya hassleriana]